MAVVASRPVGVSNAAVASHPVGVSNLAFSAHAPSSVICSVSGPSAVDGGDGNVGLDAEFAAAAPISKEISSCSSPCAPVSVVGGGLPAPPPGGSRPNAGVLKKVALVVEPFPVCRSIALSLEEDTVAEIDHAASVFAAHGLICRFRGF
ncbi:hypothetical protein SUGI_0750240 [Cryptomeria japonica]|nr:hypothetical protein SUGI_0750240 [Cryptomeria japonica]